MPNFYLFINYAIGLCFMRSYAFARRMKQGGGKNCSLDFIEVLSEDGSGFNWTYLQDFTD